MDTKPMLLALSMSLPKTCSRQRERCMGKSEMAKEKELARVGDKMPPAPPTGLWGLRLG